MTTYTTHIIGDCRSGTRRRHHGLRGRRSTSGWTAAGARLPGRGGPWRAVSGPAPVEPDRDQKAQVKSAHWTEQRAQTDAQSPGSKLMELQRASSAAVFADAPDAAQIDQLRASIAEAEAAALATRVDLQLKIAQILTPEQRQRARELADRARRPGTSGRQARRERRSKRRRNTPVTIPDV